LQRKRQTEYLESKSFVSRKSCRIKGRGCKQPPPRLTSARNADCLVLSEPFISQKISRSELRRWSQYRVVNKGNNGFIGFV